MIFLSLLSDSYKTLCAKRHIGYLPEKYLPYPMVFLWWIADLGNVLTLVPHSLQSFLLQAFGNGGQIKYLLGYDILYIELFLQKKNVFQTSMPYMSNESITFTEFNFAYHNLLGWKIILYKVGIFTY